MAYYRKKALQEMVPWTSTTLMDHVSISEADKIYGCPMEGDMIATNPKDPSDRWLVAKKFFHDNYEFVGETLEEAGGL